MGDLDERMWEREAAECGVACTHVRRKSGGFVLSWMDEGADDNSNLVDPASSHMLVSKIKPCMSKYKLLYGETANGSLKQL